VMHEGRIHQLADPQTLYTRPSTRFVAGFVGEADVLPASRVDTYLVDTPLGQLPTMEAVTTDEVAALIRPESLEVTADPRGEATVMGIEYFGHDQLVHLRLTDGSTLRARRGPLLDLDRGDRVRIDLIGPVVTFGPGAI
jgi:iron(III) transport system ATP-binding protein